MIVEYSSALSQPHQSIEFNIFLKQFIHEILKKCSNRIPYLNEE